MYIKEVGYGCQTPFEYFHRKVALYCHRYVRSDRKIWEGGLMLRRCVNSPCSGHFVSTPRLPLSFTSCSHAHGAKSGEPDGQVHSSVSLSSLEKKRVSPPVPKLPGLREDNCFIFSLLLTFVTWPVAAAFNYLAFFSLFTCSESCERPGR